METFAFVKKLIGVIHKIIFIFFLIVGCNRDQEDQVNAGSDQSLKGSIAISGAFALYPMTVKWAEEFNKVHPDVRIDISAGGAGKGMADALSGTVDLGMFSRAIMQAEKERGVWWVAVCIDAVLPTISAKNPVLADLKKQGLKRQAFVDIFMNGNIKTWPASVGANGNIAINIYTRSDACGAAGTWAQYLGGVQEDLKGIGVFGDPGLADAVKNDPLGIGFNNTIYIYNLNTNRKYDGLEVIPIDVNENGMIDKEENFYDTMDQVLKAIADGRYPSPPARELYLVANGKPKQTIVRKFLQWILSEGQRFVAEAGYVKLSDEYINQEMKKLDEN